MKIDRVNWLVKHFAIREDATVIDRAKRTIKSYELEAITASEKAFEKAVRRDSKRNNLSYFFGILRNIQQDIDDEAYKSYCRKRYNYHSMLKIERQQQDMLQQPQPSIADIVSMLEKAVTISVRFVKELAMRKPGPTETADPKVQAAIIARQQAYVDGLMEPTIVPQRELAEKNKDDS